MIVILNHISTLLLLYWLQMIEKQILDNCNFVLSKLEN